MCIFAGVKLYLSAIIDNSERCRLTLTDYIYQRTEV